MADRTGPERKPLRRRLAAAWTRVKRLFRREGPPDLDWRLPDEPALVPVGGGPGPTRSGAVALELPREPENTDAYGRETT